MEINLTRYERETVVIFNEAEPDAELYTTSAVTMRKMDKLVAEDNRFTVTKTDNLFFIKETTKSYSHDKRRTFGQDKGRS